MARNVWHKRYHGDALNGYMGLTLEQRGAYTTLLDLMYDTDWEIGIRDADRWIAGHLNVSLRRWKMLRDELMAAGKIDLFAGTISNFRYRKERENALEISRKRAENGSKGGSKNAETSGKANNIKGDDEAIASALPLYARAAEAEAEADKSDVLHTSQRAKRGTRLKDDWIPGPLPGSVAELVAQWPTGRETRELEQFRDYWATRTANAAKLDWDRTWHNRIRDQHDRIMKENRNGNRQSRTGWGSTGDAIDDWVNGR